MAENQYIYAVARIRTKELALLTNTDINQLLLSSDYKSCIKLLVEKGWGENGFNSVEELLSGEREKTWSLISELVDDKSVFDVLLYQNDFNNLKAAIKQAYIGYEVPNTFIKSGIIPYEKIIAAIQERDFNSLPEYMKKCADEAYYVLFHTGDSQLCDAIIDKATLEAIYTKGQKTKNKLLIEYSELLIVVANIKIALRSNKTQKSKEFLQRAIADCKTLEKQRLIEAALTSIEDVYTYLSTTIYSNVVEAIKESPSAFEKWCDNLIIEHIKPQKYNPFTVSPLIAYILARENEIKTIRILLSGKQNDFPEEKIRERLRDMYV